MTSGEVVQNGESVVVTEGPFSGREGRVAGLAGQRVIISMHLGCHHVHVEMDIDCVTSRAPQRKAVARISESVIEQSRSGQV